MLYTYFYIAFSLFLHILGLIKHPVWSDDFMFFLSIEKVSFQTILYIMPHDAIKRFIITVIFIYSIWITVINNSNQIAYMKKIISKSFKMYSTNLNQHSNTRSIWLCVETLSWVCVNMYYSILFHLLKMQCYFFVFMNHDACKKWACICHFAKTMPFNVGY